MNHTEITLEFTRIKEMLMERALSDTAKEKLSHLEPYLNERQCKKKQEDTTQARRILDSLGTPPLPEGNDLPKLLALANQGAMLLPEQLTAISTFLTACRRMVQYLERSRFLEISLSYFGDTFRELSELQNSIGESIHANEILSSASPQLRNIRRKLEAQQDQIRRKLEELLRGRKELFSDSYISLKNGRYVLPVKKECKSQIPGSVIEVSGTGSTCFIEPASTARLQEEWSQLKIEEDTEIRTILYTLTAMVEESAPDLLHNMEEMTALDVLFAKAKLSQDMKAVPARITTDRSIVIEEGRHPLLPRETCVPLNLTVGGDITGIIITGPNTGGKTVALKTVGLLSMMVQSGLHVPVKNGSFTMNNLVLCDIGDGQSISESLSTFSSHIKNIIRILDSATEESLVLLDELGSGTDPAEGMGIAISILEELRQRGCLFVATTHYPEVKEYAARAEKLINARMAFDKESLKPLYRLEIGEAGESCALYIAKKLGFPGHMLDLAQTITYENPAQAGTFSFPDSQAEKKQASHSQVTSPSIQKEKAVKPAPEAIPYQLGDSVMVLPDHVIGLVFSPADDKGMVGVQVKGVKTHILHKRLELKARASELYPPDYDFSIVFDTVENRKARHQMDRKYSPEVSVEYPT